MTATPYNAIESSVIAFGRFRKRWRGLNGLGWFVILAPGSLLLWFLLDWIIGLPAWPLLITFAIVVGVWLWAAVRHLIWPQFGRVTAEHEALEIERLHGKLDNQVIGSLQLGREVAAAADPAKLGYSPAMVGMLIERTAVRLNESAPHNLIDTKPAKNTLMAAAAIAVVILGIVVFAHAAVAARIDRLQDAYLAVLDSLFPVDMKVTPGDIAVVRGRPVQLGVQVIGARRKNVTLTRTDIATKTVTTDILPLDNRMATLKIPAAAASFNYVFEYGGKRSAEHKVLVGDLPELSAIQYEMAYPAYTGVPVRTLNGRVSRLQALRGTRVLVALAATTALHPDMCYVQWQDGAKQPLSVSGRSASFSFTMDQADRATIHLTGASGRGFEMENPLSFELLVQRDEAPQVTILLKTRKFTMLAEQAAVFAVNYLAEDDFGVAEVTLNYKIDTIDELLGRPTRESQISRRIEPARDRVKGIFEGVFKDLNPALQPGDRITITVSAKDNNTETGPSLGRSTPVEIVIVRQDLGVFAEQNFPFGADTLLGGLTKVKRATNLLKDPDKSVRTEVKQPVEKQDLKSRVASEGWPSGSQDATAEYFQLLSGESK